ncbi:MAG: B12-binding domain-containing radical SAM protein [Actinobacteria bacterium]|nr:B12-binding domain-containing radical SAM protein [Actinomycetota bacterium]
MKVVLVAPNSKAHTITPPLGLGYLAASLRLHGHEPVIVDLAKQRLDGDRGAEAVLAHRPDLIGVGILSTAYLPARALIEAIKARRPETPLVAGGPHITALPDDALKNLGVELGVVGEGEIVFPELVDRLAAGQPVDGNVPSVCRQARGEVTCSQRSEFIRDLDSLPFPAWDLIDPRTYPDLPHQLLHKKFPVAPVMTSRGCPFDCNFCASTTLWGRGWRTRSPGNVVDEIELLVRDFQVKEIHFEDDNFTLKKSHAATVCEEIIRRRLDIVWCTPNGVRVDSLDEEMVSLMRRSGCYGLAFGIESGSQKVLDINNKKLDLAKVAAKVEMVKRHGIETHGFFIVGLPGETVETIKETMEFARRVPFDRANFALLAPLPGSDIFQEYLRRLDGKEIDYSSFNYFTPFPMGELDAATLNRWQRRLVFSFYGRPRQLWTLARHLRPAQVKEVAKALIHYST